jgi:hypothetical protein
MNEQLEPPQINERLWQKWIWKNREMDKADARKRLRFFQVLLVVTIGAVVVQNFMK